MRLNKLLMVALAGMTLFSCSNDDEPGNGNLSNEEKTVVLKLEGIKSVKTRSTDTPTSDSDEKTITVNKVAILFYDESADKVLQAEEVKSSDTDWATLTGAGKEYTKVNASVDKVMIIGNASEDLEKLLQVGSSPKEIRKYQYSLEKENTAGTGTDKTTKGNVSLYGDAGIELETEAADDQDAVYKASVKLNPLVARFEIRSVGCKFPSENANYKKLVLKGIGLVHYYSEATIASQDADNGTITTTADAQKMPVDGTDTAVENGIFDPEFAGDITGNGSYKFCDTNEAEWAWSYDAFDTDAPSITPGDTGGEQKFKDTDDKEYTFAYNFFPQDGDNQTYHTPNICAWVEAYETEDGTPDEDHTVVTSTMLKGNKPLVPKAGEIYQLDYLFEEGDIDEWIPTITVKVNVTVAKWSIITVTPEF